MYFLLDLEIFGRTLHLSSGLVGSDGIVTDTVDGSKQAIPYRPGLTWQRSFPRTMTRWDASPPDASVDVTVDLWTSYRLDVPLAISEGGDPGAGTAVMKLWSEADTVSVEIIRGKLRDPQWGNKSDPLVATIDMTPSQDTGLIVQRSQTLINSTWPNHDNGRLREFYPVVFGSPSGYETNHWSGSPGLLVDTAASTVLLAGHLTVAGVDGDDVTVSNYTQGFTNTGTAASATDGYGQKCTTLDASGFGAGAQAPVTGDNLWIAWRSGSTTTYGLYNDQNAAMRGMGDLLFYIARLSRGFEWDFGRLSNMRERLNTIQVDGYIMPAPDEVLSPYDWLAEYILSVVPASMHISEGAVWARLWDFTATADDAVARIIAGRTRGDRNAERITSYGTTPLSDVQTDYRVEYVYNHRRDKSRGSILVTGSKVDYQQDDDAVLDGNLSRSYNTHGPMPVASIQLPQIEDRSSALRIAASRAAAAGPQRAIAGYSVDRYPGGMLEPGDVVLVTDDDCYWSDRLAVVTDAAWTDGPKVEIQVEIMDAGALNG